MKSKIKLSPQLISAACLDAGNRNMREHMRNSWNEEDYEKAAQISQFLWEKYDIQEHGFPLNKVI